MTKPDNPFPRSLDIAALFSCNDYSTQENFYQLLQSSNYAFANNYNDFGKFIIQYYTDDQLYSSINVENSSFQINVSNIEEIKPQFHTEPSGNNGVPASVDVTLTFSCLLVNSNGDHLLIENAKVNGRFYRQSPGGYYWEDWGKGWN